jgi:hypothetical protein
LSRGGAGRRSTGAKDARGGRDYRRQIRLPTGCVSRGTGDAPFHPLEARPGPPSPKGRISMSLQATVFLCAASERASAVPVSLRCAFDDPRSAPPELHQPVLQDDRVSGQGVRYVFCNRQTCFLRPVDFVQVLYVLFVCFLFDA